MYIFVDDFICFFIDMTNTTTITLDETTYTMLHQVTQMFSQMTGAELEYEQVVATLCSSFLDGIQTQSNAA